MEGCIHPECVCTGYKQSTGTKGTLLVLKIGCLGCGHVGAEHRRLTATDAFIRSEVQIASSMGCGHQIPVVDVPRSPVFRLHDPIYLPWGDSTQDSSVMCMCTGFTTSSVVGLQQSLYKCPQSEVKTELEKSLCTFCQHPLSVHKGKSLALAVGLSDVAMLSRLRLKGLAESSELTSPCVLALDHDKRQFIFVCLRSSTELVALRTDWDSKEALNSSISEPNKMETEEVESSETVPMETSDATETPSKTAKRGRVKRTSSGVRKSARLEAKKKASLKSSNKEETKPEVIVPVEATERFVRELGEPASFKKLGDLPKELTGSPSLAVLSTSDGLVVALADQSGGWVGVVFTNGALVWSTLAHNEHINYTCLSLEKSPTDIYVAMGTVSGEVVVWKVGLDQMCVSTELVGCLQDSKSQVTAIKWMPGAKTLAVGCFHGDVLLCSCEDGLSLAQTVHVCGGSVMSLAWSVDGRSLAVGGSDDCVQVLVSPPTSARPPTTHHANHPTLFSYFKRLGSPKFRHTLTLKGHQSFVSDVHFTRSGLLLTLGWDGQVLVWTSSQDPHPHTEDSDPVSGFKIGPSTSAKFLPLSVVTVDSGLLVVVGNKHSRLSVIHYSL